MISIVGENRRSGKMKAYMIFQWIALDRLSFRRFSLAAFLDIVRIRAMMGVLMDGVVFIGEWRLFNFHLAERLGGVQGFDVRVA